MITPDFIIAGGMKCGTSTLHRTLTNHPNIHLLDGEQYLLDFDDQIEHPHFPSPPAALSCEKTILRYIRSSYNRLFDPGPLNGERSTTYLYSRKTPERIEKLFPNVKIIILLRNPIFRAYSHYWHRVRTGRATTPFNKCIRTTDSAILRRGNYRKCIARYQTFFSSDQLHFIVFERFINQTESVLNEVLEFLNLDANNDLLSLYRKGNEGRIPLSVPLQLKLNQISKRLIPFRYDGHLPGSQPDYFKKGLLLLDRCIRRLLNVRWKNKPPMSDESRSYLETYYRMQNDGLSDMIDRNLGAYWSFLS